MGVSFENKDSEQKFRSVKLAKIGRLGTVSKVYEKGVIYELEESEAIELLKMKDTEEVPYFVEHFEKAEVEKKKEESKPKVERVKTEKKSQQFKEPAVDASKGDKVIDLSDDDPDVLGHLASAGSQDSDPSVVVVG